MILDPKMFPDVPVPDRFRTIFVNQWVPENIIAAFRERGWEVRDVRLLPRSDAVRATLEGVRMGTIGGDKELLAFLNLEARIEKLLTNKEAADVPEGDTLDTEDISAILTFGVPSKLPWKKGDLPPGKKKIGRPKNPKGPLK